MHVGDSVLLTQSSMFTYSTTWTIENFTFLMKTGTKESLRSDIWKVPLGSSGRVSEWQLSCSPYKYDRYYPLRLNLKLDLINNEEVDLAYEVSPFCFLDVSGVEHSVEGDSWSRGNSSPCGFIRSATVPHSWLRDEGRKLLCDDKLTIRVHLKILADFRNVADTWVSNKQLVGVNKAEDIHSHMMESKVDLGPSRVLLVCKDEELWCHTFPLAARYGTVPYLLLRRSTVKYVS
jgi:hypothetical protein